MTKRNFFMNFQIWAATASIPVMKMLAEQAEKNVTLAVKEADEPGAVTENEHEDEGYDRYGESYPILLTYYSCGSCVGYDYDEVKLEYKHLISQLTRRSAYLTMFGLFEHRMNNCLGFMIKLSKHEGEINGKGPIEKAHNILKRIIGAKDLVDVDHLTVIRNIMIHNDGVATDYNKIITRQEKKNTTERRLLGAIRRAEGISVNSLNDVLMDAKFLNYAVKEFNRYVDGMEAAVQNYQRLQKSEEEIN